MANGAANHVHPITRILHVDASRVWRGGQQQLLFLAQELRRLGQQQVIVARLGAVFERLQGEGFEVLPPGAGARQAARQAGIVHAHDGHAHAWALWATLQMPGRPSPRPRRVLSRRVAYPIRGAASRWKYRHTDLVIAVSEYVKQQVLRTGIEAWRVEVIPDGIALDALPAAALTRARLRARLGLGEGERLIVCVAALTPEKGVADLIEAVAGLPDRCHLALTGEGPLRAQLIEQTARLRCATRVHFAAPGEASPAEWVAAADLFAMPSREEGLGSAALLAMALGCPVVATNVGGIPELIEHDSTGLLVAPGDSAAFAAACRRCLDEPTTGARFAAVAVERVRARYTIERMAAATLAAYDTLTRQGTSL